VPLVRSFSEFAVLALQRITNNIFASVSLNAFWRFFVPALFQIAFILRCASTYRTRLFGKTCVIRKKSLLSLGFVFPIFSSFAPFGVKICLLSYIFARVAKTDVRIKNGIFFEGRPPFRQLCLILLN
jgi:hypothetical protein